MAIIKRRNATPVIDYNEVDDKARWYEKVGEPKPKEPLPKPNIMPGANGLPMKEAEPAIRTIGAMFANDQARAEGHEFNVHDILVCLRTPLNKGDRTEMRYRARIKNRGTAITAFCVECMGGSRKQVTECRHTACPLWGFRFGSDPFRGRR